jgi:hypothetical protein
MRKYCPTQGDWVKYCATVLGRKEPLFNHFSLVLEDRRTVSNFRAWYRRQHQATA